jgi:hypothetical protein
VWVLPGTAVVFSGFLSVLLNIAQAYVNVNVN